MFYSSFIRAFNTERASLLHFRASLHAVMLSVERTRFWTSSAQLVRSFLMFKMARKTAKLFQNVKEHFKLS